MKENDEQFSGDKLDEPGDKESKSIAEEGVSGGELDEPEDEESESIPEEGASGGELDEPEGELDAPEDKESKSIAEEGASGGELDDPGDKEGESVPEEEQFSGDELDELSESGDEESKSIPEEGVSGGELDEPEDEESESIPEEGASGGELDEPEGELDAPEDKESEAIPEEGEFSGGELDEPEDELDEPEDEESESIPEEEDSEGIEGEYRGKKRLLLCIAAGLCLLIGIGYLYLKWKGSDIPLNQKEWTSQINRLAIPKDRLLIFHSFVIPLKENREFTYISLSISFNVPNIELKREMIEKKGRLRGIIYDMLREEMNKVKEIPPLEKLKESITRGVNAALSAGKVNKVYITNFLAV